MIFTRVLSASSWLLNQHSSLVFRHPFPIQVTFVVNRKNSFLAFKAIAWNWPQHHQDWSFNLGYNRMKLQPFYLNHLARSRSAVDYRYQRDCTSQRSLQLRQSQKFCY